MTENTPDNESNESNILIEEEDESIQASKLKPTPTPKKPAKRKNLKYEKVIEVIKSSSPDLNERVKPKPVKPKVVEAIESVNPVEPKIRKKRSDTGIKKDMSKAIEVRDKNRQIQRDQKLKLQEEYDKEYEAKIIEKAVQLKKAQLKRNRQIESVKISEESLKPKPNLEKPNLEEQLKPQKKFTFF